MAEKVPDGDIKVMEKIDMKKDFLTDRDRMYIEKMNMMRMQATLSKAQKAKSAKKNLFIGLGLGAIALSFYAYTFYAVGQESFLDDFDDPNKPKD